jgi:phage repressor protein C with HTH and peptisase S24 domain
MGRLAKLYRVDMNEYLFGNGSHDTVYVEFDAVNAAAGAGVEVDDYYGKKMVAVSRGLIAPRNPENLRGVAVKGDSMSDERICDGDTVIFDTTDKAAESICVLSIDNRLLVKRVVYDTIENSIILLSANAAYPPRVIRGADVASVRIAGKVVAVLHRV